MLFSLVVVSSGCIETSETNIIQEEAKSYDAPEQFDPSLRSIPIGLMEDEGLDRTQVSGSWVYDGHANEQFNFGHNIVLRKYEKVGEIQNISSSLKEFETESSSVNITTKRASSYDISDERLDGINRSIEMNLETGEHSEIEEVVELNQRIILYQEDHYVYLFLYSKSQMSEKDFYSKFESEVKEFIP